MLTASPLHHIWPVSSGKEKQLLWGCGKNLTALGPLEDDGPTEGDDIVDSKLVSPKGRVKCHVDSA